MQAAYPECICPPARQEKGKGREEKGKKERGGRSASCVWLAELSGNRVHWLELCHVVTCAFPEVTPTHLLTSHWLERCHVATQTFLAVSSIPLLTSHWSELCHMATRVKVKTLETVNRKERWGIKVSRVVDLSPPLWDEGGKRLE